MGNRFERCSIGLIFNAATECVAKSDDINGFAAKSDDLVPLPVCKGQTYYALTVDEISGYWLCYYDGRVGFVMGYQMEKIRPVTILMPNWLASAFSY